MKEDRLEEFIRNNRDAFEHLEAGNDNWERIQSNIKPLRKIDYPRFLWKAASVILIFGASFMVNEIWHQQRNEQTMADRSSNELDIPELLEAEMYYSSKMDSKLLELQSLNVLDKSVTTDLKVELEELDKAYAELKEDLKDDMDNEEIVEAMIQNYRIKVRMLEEIISRIRKSEKISEENETRDYEI